MKPVEWLGSHYEVQLKNGTDRMLHIGERVYLDVRRKPNPKTALFEFATHRASLRSPSFVLLRPNNLRRGCKGWFAMLETAT